MPKLPWKPWHGVMKLRDDLKSGLKNRDGTEESEGPERSRRKRGQPLAFEYLGVSVLLGGMSSGTKGEGRERG